MEKYFKVRPTNLLMYEAIKDACDRGYAWFDFNPSGGHEGVEAFKKNFGAQALPAPVIQSTSPRTRLVKGAVNIANFFKKNEDS